MGVTRRTGKRPFNIHAVMQRIRLELKQFADAAMFDLGGGEGGEIKGTIAWPWS